MLNKGIKYYVLCIRGFLILFLPIILTTYFILQTAPPAFAQTSTPSAPSLPASNLQLPSSISPTSPLFTDLLVHNVFHSFSCLAVGQSVIGQPCLTYQITKNAQGAIQGIPVLSQADMSGGVLGTTTSLIGALYLNPPVRTADYLASVGQNFGIVKEAHAQVVGSGANVLSPILSLWTVSRNISYVIMIIIFVIIGLMVMFRQRINPQTVITAQAALPGLVIGLILITFSYFLAGLISDMAFVGTNAVGYYFAAAQGPKALADPDRTNLVQKISGESVLNIFSPLVGIIDHDKASSIMSSIFDKVGPAAQSNLRLLAGILTAQFIAPFAGVIPPPWGLIIGPATSILGGGVVATNPPAFLGFVVAFIATLALIYQMLKLLLRLLTSYLTIVFLTLSAPFHFLAAALPGRQGIATNWILNMLGNILIFPAVLAVFYFIAFILGPKVVDTDYPLKVSDSSYIENGLIPKAHAEEEFKIVDKNTLPLFGGLNLDFIKILLAFGALMALPKIPDLVVSTVGKTGQAGQLLGQEISGGIRSGQGYGSQIQRSGQEQLLSAKRNLVGEHGLIYNPRTGEYQPGLTQAGFFTRKTILGGPETPIKPTPKVR